MDTEKKPYDRYEADKRYNQKNSRQYGLKLIRHLDMDIIKEFEAQPTVQGYVKRLVREDLNRRTEWSAEKLKAMLYAHGGTYNGLYTMARRASYEDNEHAFAVCLVNDGNCAVLQFDAGADIKKVLSSTYYMMKVYTDDQHLTAQQIDEKMASFNPIFDRIEAMENASASAND